MVVTQSALIDQNHFETNQLLFPEGLVHHFQWVESARCLNVATTAVLCVHSHWLLPASWSSLLALLLATMAK